MSQLGLSKKEVSTFCHGPTHGMLSARSTTTPTSTLLTRSRSLTGTMMVKAVCTVDGKQMEQNPSSNG